MAVQIANPNVVRKIERLAATLNISKTGAVERALDAFSGTLTVSDRKESKRLDRERRKMAMLGILASCDRLPDAVPGKNDLDWDAYGLPI